MAQTVEAVVTDAWRSKIAASYAAQPNTIEDIDSFKIGEGGWIDPGGGKEPIPPDPTFTDLTAPTYPAGSQFVYSGSIGVADLAFTAPNRLEIRVFVDSSEANDDGTGNPPEFFELGIFDAGGTMLVYSTFPLEIKTASKSLEHLIFVDF